MGIKVVSKNRKAGFEYFLLERYEAGISLVGSEIKSVRASQVNISEAYIRVNSNEAWLVNAHIAPYDPANRYNHDPLRERRLLLRKREIKELWDAIRQKGFTVIPVQIYLKEGRAKLEIALARGKKLFDKRHEIARRDAEMEMKIRERAK